MYVLMYTRIKEKMRMYVCMDVYRDKRKDENVCMYGCVQG